ncbi:MAG: extracellular solute-binding protein [Lachnospiraceae bacterium]|nr:extracellular solute-binding protein [Lachnospiraceae bacterium]
MAAIKDTPVYFYNMETVSASPVDWNIESGEYIVSMAANEETIYLAVNNGSRIKVRRGREGRPWEDIADFSLDDVGNLCSFWVDKQENFYFISDHEIYITNGENQNRRLSLDGRLIFWEESGKVKCLAGSQECLRLIDIEAEEPVEEWSFAYPCTHNLIRIDNSDSEVWLVVDESLLCISMVSGEILSETDLLQCGISTMNIYCGAFADRDSEDEKLLLYGKSAGNRLIVYQLGKMLDSAALPREEVVYGTLAINSTMMNQIVEFNKQSREYYVTVQIYGNGDLENGRIQLQAALSGDDGPDIINVFFVDNCDGYVRNGYFEDLTSYIQATEENGNDKQGEVMWQIMEPYFTDGKVYILLPHFTLSGLVISPEDTEGMADWNVKEMFRLIEKNAGQKSIFTTSTAENVLLLAVRGMQGDFIDYSTKTCNFEREEFIRLLEYCRQYGRESDWSGTMSMGDMAQRTLFLDMTFSSYMEYLLTQASYGQGIELYGYPTVKGQEYIVNKSIDACAMNAKSNNKAGAWTFMESLLHFAYQETEGLGWPICKGAYYNVWAYNKGTAVRIKGTDYYVDEQDKEMFDYILENGSFQSGAIDENIMNIIQEETASYFAGDKSAQEVARIIQSRVQLVLNE